MSRTCSMSPAVAGPPLVLSSAAHAAMGGPLLASELAKTAAPAGPTDGLGGRV
jgi:hypothetical protein